MQAKRSRGDNALDTCSELRLLKNITDLHQSGTIAAQRVQSLLDDAAEVLFLDRNVCDPRRWMSVAKTLPETCNASSCERFFGQGCMCRTCQFSIHPPCPRSLFFSQNTKKIPLAFMNCVSPSRMQHPLATNRQRKKTHPPTKKNKKREQTLV